MLFLGEFFGRAVQRKFLINAPVFFYGECFRDRNMYVVKKNQLIFHCSFIHIDCFLTIKQKIHYSQLTPEIVKIEKIVKYKNVPHFGQNNFLPHHALFPISITSQDNLLWASKLKILTLQFQPTSPNNPFIATKSPHYSKKKPQHFGIVTKSQITPPKYVFHPKNALIRTT